MSKYEAKAAIIKSGKSQVFANWQKCGLISEEEFLSALKWLCDDPEDAPGGHMTREIGLEITPDMKMKLFMESSASDMQKAAFGRKYDKDNLKGRIVKLRRVHGRLGDFIGFYTEDGRLWSGGISLSIRDRI